MGTTTNVAGLAAQRTALAEWLRTLPQDVWNETVRSVVNAACDRYVEAAESDADVIVPDDPRKAADILDRIGVATELTFTDKDEPGNKQGGIDVVMRELFELAGYLGRLTGHPVATPPEARDAAVAAAVWRAADKVEAPVRIILDTGADYVVGAGEPEGVVHTDSEAVLEVAGGRADPAHLARSGRWRFDGPDEAREAFERTFRL
jgi:hypothetical protein